MLSSLVQFPAPERDPSHCRTRAYTGWPS